jgi:hypothetical protein
MSHTGALGLRVGILSDLSAVGTLPILNWICDFRLLLNGTRQGAISVMKEEEEQYPFSSLKHCRPWHN